MSGITVGIGPRSALDFEQLAVSTSAVPITAAILETYANGKRNQAIGATLSVTGGPVRFTVDGTTPTSAIGHYVGPEATFEIWGIINLKALQLIRVSTDASVAITTWSE